MKRVPLAIVGGGAAGLFAAAVAAERRIGCVLIERKARLGSKVLMTANGRCNFTKDISADQFLRDLHLPAVESFLSPAIHECPPRSIIKGFQSLNVPLRRMADGRMFPADGKAATIVHAFGDLLRDEEVPVLTNCAVREIQKIEVEGRGRERNFAFLVRMNAFDLLADNVLLATGGVSYPKTGSVGDGQRFAAALGHRLVPYRPGLIGLETNDPRVTSLAGRRFEDDGRVKVFGSSLVPRSLTRSEPHDRSSLSSTLVPHSLTRSEPHDRSSLYSPLVPHSLTRSEPHDRSLSGSQLLFDYRGEVDCERFGLSGAAIYNAQRFLEHCRDTSGMELEVWFGRNRLKFPVSKLKPRPVKEAIVTIGGVDISEIDPRTMQSKLVPGLYFAGEVMDVDGPTGGYNLTIAFATARKAVTSL